MINVVGWRGSFRLSGGFSCHFFLSCLFSFYFIFSSSPAVEASAEANPGTAGGPGHHAT